MIKIAVDLDECLFPMMRSLDRYMNRVYDRKPDPRVREYDYARRYDVSSPNMKRIVRDFYSSKEQYSTVPVPGSVHAMQKLKRRYELVIVTGRQTYAKSATERFLNVYFPYVFDSVEYTNSYSLQGRERTKKSVCKRNRVSILIDDHPSYLNQCKEELLAIGFVGEPRYPWAYDDMDIPTFSSWSRCPLFSAD